MEVSLAVTKLDGQSGISKAEKDEDSAIVEFALKMIQASKWDGDKKSKMSVVKCLASTLTKLNVKDEGEDTGSDYFDY
jgi:hypothetical protein